MGAGKAASQTDKLPDSSRTTCFPHTNQWRRNENLCPVSGSASERNWSCSSLCGQKIGAVFVELRSSGEVCKVGWITAITALKSFIKYPLLDEKCDLFIVFNKRITAAKENNCFQFPIRLVRRGEAGASSEDSWVLVTHRAPAGWDIDPRMAAHLAKPPNGWLLMHVCARVCVCVCVCVRTVSERSHFSLNVRKIRSRMTLRKSRLMQSNFFYFFLLCFFYTSYSARQCSTIRCYCQNAG